MDLAGRYANKSTIGPDHCGFGLESVFIDAIFDPILYSDLTSINLRKWIQFSIRLFMAALWLSGPDPSLETQTHVWPKHGP